MATFPYHKPACWQLFRNEPLEEQNRRAAIQKSHANANTARRKDTGLWWDAQKHVDQVVPAEFITPDEIDTSTYRYQVFARPPPIQCQPTSLQEVSDAIPPIRYNVKRVAVDKPFPAADFECAGHWSRRPFRLQRNCHAQSGGSRQDCSKNNNTQPSLISVGNNHHQTFVKSCDMPGIVLNEVYNDRKENKNTNQIKNSNAFCKQIQQTPSKPNMLCDERYVYGNGNHFNPQEKSCERVTKNLQSVPDNKTVHSGSHQSINWPRWKLNDEDIRPESVPPSKPNDLAQDVVVESPRSMRSFSRRRNLPPSHASSLLSNETMRSNKPKHDLDTNRNRSPGENAALTREKSSINLHGHNRANAARSNTSIASDASSIASVSTFCSPRKVATSPKPPPEVSRVGEGRFGMKSASKSRSRDSVASLLSNGGDAPSPPRRGNRRRCVIQPSTSGRDSVASILADSSNNNVHARAMFDPSLIFQDVFEDPPTLAGAQGIIYLGSESHSNGCSRAKDCLGIVYLEHNPFGNANTTIIEPMEASDHECTNNNALVNKPGVYNMQCCPLEPCGAIGHSTCDGGPNKLLCRFHGKYPAMSDDQSVCLEEIKNKAKVAGTEKERFRCRPLPSCATGKEVEGGGGPLVVCERERPTTPEIGYGTYKLVGSLQRRERPLPNYADKLSLPPDLEEYREFTRRCPNYKLGRYDRRNPLNLMLLPSNKSSVLLRGASANPFIYTRMPRQTLPPLFEPVKVRSDLSWNLPTFLRNK